MSAEPASSNLLVCPVAHADAAAAAAGNLATAANTQMHVDSKHAASKHQLGVTGSLSTLCDGQDQEGPSLTLFFKAVLCYTCA